jgi:hypothetical protein
VEPEVTLGFFTLTAADGSTLNGNYSGSAEYTDATKTSPGRCRDRELTGGVNDPQPDRHAGKIAIRSKLFRPYSTFYVSLITVAAEHQAGGSPDVYLRDHARKGYPVNVYLRLMPNRGTPQKAIVRLTLIERTT